MVRSILAVLAGLVFIVATHTGTDLLMHENGVFPPPGVPMFDPWLNAAALAYRCAFAIAGCALTAVLARGRGLMHALVLGGIGTAVSAAGAWVAIDAGLGPAWYPIALAASVLPCAWAGGILGERFRAAKVR